MGEATVEIEGAGRVAGGFVWPPVPLPEEGEGGRTGATSGGRDDVVRAGGGWREVLLEFERTWLDPVAEPLERRAASIGWRRDSPEAYCDRCGHDVAEFEASEFGCAACRSMRPWWERFVRLGSYDPPLSLWIQEVKFERFHALGCSLGRALGRAVIEAGIAEGDGPVVVVPVPTTMRRRLARGIDHGAAIASGVAREIGAPMRCALRRAHRPSQRAVAPSARSANVRGVFRLARRARRRGWVEGCRVVLVDDVSTSGATVRACCRVLRAWGASGVWVACVGVTREAGRRVSDGGGAVDGVGVCAGEGEGGHGLGGADGRGARGKAGERGLSGGNPDSPA